MSLLTNLKTISKKVKYGAKVVNWLADSLASFPEPEFESGNENATKHTAAATDKPLTESKQEVQPAT